jgi:sporulation protein YlmC with PRC-barrel domain
VRVSDLIGTSVRTQSGERLGRVYDLRAELTGKTPKVTGICVGGPGLLERLGIGSPSSRLRSHDVIAWADVVRADRRGIVVRDGVQPR